MSAKTYSRCPKCNKSNNAYEAKPVNIEGIEFDIVGWTTKFHCSCGKYYDVVETERVSNVRS